MAKKKGRKGNEGEVGRMVGAALLMALGGVAVASIALAIRSQVGEALGVVLLVVAGLGMLYAVMWFGGAAMFVFFDQLVRNTDRAVSGYWIAFWIVALASIPLTAYLLEFDRDQWVWGTGSTVAGLLIAVVVLYRPRRKT